MAQLDKELFFEYIVYIFLILVHMYSTSYFNKTFMWLNVRLMYLNTFFLRIRTMDEQLNIIKNIQNNFKNTIK